MFIADTSIIIRYSRIYFERSLSKFHVGFNEHHILMYLSSCDSVNQDTIAKYFMIDKGAIAKTLNKLELKEFITRVDNPNNKREKIISLTKKGKSMIDHLNQCLDEWHNLLFQGLSNSEIEQITNYTEKISANAVKAIIGGSIINDKEN